MSASFTPTLANLGEPQRAPRATTDVTDPLDLLAALDAGEPHRPEWPELEKLVADAIASGERRLFAAARRGLLVVRRIRREEGSSTARVDDLLRRVREARGEVRRAVG